MSWREQAACKGRTRTFFLEVFDPVSVKLCNTCPVKVECQQVGITENHGVWGGLTVEQRRRVVEKRKPSRRAA